MNENDDDNEDYNIQDYVTGSKTTRVPCKHQSHPSIQVQLMLSSRRHTVP